MGEGGGAAAAPAPGPAPESVPAPIATPQTTLSVVQLDTRFPRLPGDVASPQTYDCRLERMVMPGLSVARVVTDTPDPGDLDDVENALGAAAGQVVATSCGFLCHWQSRLEAVCPAPFISSSLLDLPRLVARHGADGLAVVTFDADTLRAPFYRDALAGFDGPVIGLDPQSHLRQVIAGDLPELDAARAGAELADLVGGSIKDRDVRALLLECTNLAPYKQELKTRFNVEVYDILTMINDVHPCMVKPEFL